MVNLVVYAAAPLGQRTAGPEALTQFVDAVRRRGVEAYLIPMRTYRGKRNDPEYDIYDFAVAERIVDPRNAILVVPEISLIESRRELSQVPRHRTWLGWFSVNNCPDPRARYFRPSEACCPTYPPDYLPEILPVPADLGLGTPPDPGALLDWREARRRAPGWSPSALRNSAVDAVSMRFGRSIIDDPDVRHFAQSFYAQGFVREVLKREARIITDPIRVVDVAPQPRERNVVIYNEVKSWSMIPAVQELMPDVEFRAIKGMSFQEVAQALSTSSVYLELGHMPGRDRMAREAAHFGTPVVVLARGAGYCWQDVPLPVEQRVPFREGWPELAEQAIRRVLGDPEGAQARQEGYRTWVAGERDRYEAAMDDWLAAATL